MSDFNNVYFPRGSNMYKLDLSDYSVTQVRDGVIYGVIIREAGMLKDWRGNSVEVHEGDVIFIKEEKACCAADVWDFFVFLSESKNRSIISDSCDSPSCACESAG